MKKSLRILVLIGAVFFLLSGCTSKEVFSNESFYDSFSNVSWRTPMSYDEDENELYFIDNERREIFNFNLVNNKIVSLGPSFLIDGKKQLDLAATYEKYFEVITNHLIFKEGEKMFSIVDKEDNAGNKNFYFSSSNLDGSNIKNLLKLDGFVTEYMLSSNLAVFSYIFDENSNNTTLKVYDNKLNHINDIEIEGIFLDLQIYNNEIYGTIQPSITTEKSKVLKINPYDKSTIAIGEEGYSIREINEGHYILDKPIDFDENGIGVNYESIVYKVDDNSEVFRFKDQVGYIIKNETLITSSIVGKRVYYRYDLSGNYIDELKPTDFLKEDIFEHPFVKSIYDDGRELSETDIITMPFRYGNDQIIARIISSDSGPFIICDFAKKSCELVEY